MRLLDAKTLKVLRPVKVPMGDVSMGAWKDDGTGFSILISLPERPADPYLVDAATGDVKPLREDKRRGLDQLAPIDVAIEIVRAFDGLTIPVNRYLPKDAAGKKLPAIVMFHVGPASSYAVRWNPFACMVAANEGHTVDRRETKVELLTRTARFLEDALK